MTYSIGQIMLGRLTLLRVNHTIVSITLALFSGLLCLGFIIGDPGASTNYTAFSNKFVWAAVFGAYSLVKSMQALNRMPMCTKIINSILGLWLWCYLIISFIFLDKTHMAPAELILIMPVLWELAYMTSIVYICKRLRVLKRRYND